MSWARSAGLSVQCGPQRVMSAQYGPQRENTKAAAGHDIGRTPSAASALSAAGRGPGLGWSRPPAHRGRQPVTDVTCWPGPAPQRGSGSRAVTQSEWRVRPGPLSRPPRLEPSSWLCPPHPRTRRCRGCPAPRFRLRESTRGGGEVGRVGGESGLLSRLLGLDPWRTAPR